MAEGAPPLPAQGTSDSEKAADHAPPAGGFVASRTGWQLLKQVLLLEPLPGGSRWAAAFGSLLLFSFVVQVVTGLLLAVNYSPSAESAWESVDYIQREVPLGGYIRAIHHWGSSAMVILLLAHITQVFVWGAYKKPRELTWMTGVLLLACTLGLAFTGYLLPWDQKAYWATKVGLGMVSTTPLVGDDLRTAMQGGPQLGNLTLTRFYAAHALGLPAAIVALVVVHLYLFRIHGVTPPWWESKARLHEQAEPFWPKQALKDAVCALVFIGALGFWAYYRPAPLEAPADPSEPYDARPEWYFMFLFQLLRYFHGPYEVIGTFVLPVGAFLLLFFWPLIDRNPHRDPRKRPLAIGLFVFSTLGLIGLTVFAIATDVRMKEPTRSIAAEPPPRKASALQRSDVARLFSTHCTGCHGTDGSARSTRAVMPTVPDFTSLAWQMSKTELEIAHQIQAGHEPLMPAYGDKLSSSEILALTIYVRAFHPEAVGAEAPKPVDIALPPPDASQMSAVQVYRAYCLACHDGDGSGQTVRAAMPEIPNFANSDWSKTRSDADLKKSILDGKGKFMLPMKDKLSTADADKMVAYVRGFREGKQVAKVEPVKPVEPVPNPPVAPPLVQPPTVDRPDTTERIAAATTLYREFCLTCHGADGRGRELRPSMPQLPDFTGRDWQDRSPTAQLRASILNGKGTLMPAFGGRVTEEQARDLTAYVRAFGPRNAGPKTSLGASEADDFEKQFRSLQDKWLELQKQLKELDKPKPGGK
jgi:ubiquinol-cytochrome c reductase cytochrome b subunit